MKQSVIFFVSLILSVPAFAYEDSFSYFYGSTSPMVNCGESSAFEASQSAPPQNQRNAYDHDREVEYLYGRQVLGFAEEMQDAPMPVMDGEMPYGWSLRGPVAGN